MQFFLSVSNTLFTVLNTLFERKIDGNMENANLVKIECVTITVRIMVVEEIKLTKTCALIV